MKYIIVFMLCVFGWALPAQKFSGLYIEPLISWKMDTRFFDKQPSLVTPYFTFKIQDYTLPEQFSPLNLGFNLGYEFKNHDKLQIGFMQDGTSDGFLFYGLEQSSTLKYSSSFAMSSIEWGVMYNNISLLYKKAILSINSRYFKEGRFIRMHLNFGFSYCSKPQKEEPLTSNGFSFTAPDSTLISMSANLYSMPTYWSRRLKYNLGFDFTFGKNNNEWFTLNFGLNYAQMDGFGFSRTTVSITETKGKQMRRYDYLINCKGNGFYFTLSKRLYPVKYIQKKREKQRLKYLEKNSPGSTLTN